MATTPPIRGNNTWANIRNEVTGAHVLLSRLLGLLAAILTVADSNVITIPVICFKYFTLFDEVDS